jgi:hypothetical protein
MTYRDRRFGEPKTEEERRETHYEKYGSYELPPRGTGLISQGATTFPIFISVVTSVITTIIGIAVYQKTKGKSF